MVKIAIEPPSREEQLAKLTDEQLACRATGHWWKLEMAWGARDPGSDRRQANWSTWIGDCARCGARTEVVRTAFMEQRSRRTDYPEGYLLEGSKPRGGPKREALAEVGRRTPR